MTRGSGLEGCRSVQGTDKSGFKERQSSGWAPETSRRQNQWDEVKDWTWGMGEKEVMDDV